ncbi:hypothetical protein [Virgibacillus proomii]|uniref:hypothetical protein n=1 Tax=Virgibacillus proomii TaxID=84407 RepID=UPI001C0FECFA|nr:hypothetical protein [Virgibacillus proomii]MBU5265981.1 hypothetical protein [Virgibacillus proomii]
MMRKTGSKSPIRLGRQDRVATTAILRTQKSAFLFKEKESFLNKHRTKKKCFPFSRTELLRQQYIARRKVFFFSRTELLRQQYIARRKSVLLFQGQSCYDSNTSHAEKAFFFFKDRVATAAIHRTQKKRSSFSRTQRTSSLTCFNSTYFNTPIQQTRLPSISQFFFNLLDYAIITRCRTFSILFH